MGDCLVEVIQADNVQSASFFIIQSVITVTPDLPFPLSRRRTGFVCNAAVSVVLKRFLGLSINAPSLIVFGDLGRCL